MNFYIEHQMDIMMVLEGISAFIFIFLICMKIDEKSRKSSFLQISFFTLLLLLSDRLAHMYQGNGSSTGGWIVLISNFLYYSSIILVQNGFNNYLTSLNKYNNPDNSRDTCLYAGRLLAKTGLCLLIISQFTGLYYTFDETNNYVRAPGFIICYIIPIIMTAMQLVFIIRNRRFFNKAMLAALLGFLVFPVIAGLVQIYFYGASLTSVSVSLSAIMLYISALIDQNNILIKAARKEMTTAIEMKEKYNEILQQTVEALASAVDAKDAYTHGHSKRVAQYAEKIARLSGMTDKECEDVYLAGMLHDVGKIGINDSIINKKGRLTDEESAIIKLHTEMGGRILSKIVISPSLSIGARYHHERYDGTGYPERMKGDEIPNIARIIAVADAYDAMTSKRSYRDIIPQMYVREELVKGMGTQFDPEYSRIMIKLLDADKEYNMKEKQNTDKFDSYSSYEVETYKSKISAGVLITDHPLSLKIQYRPVKDGGQPTLLFYDSADARYYLKGNSISEEMDFIEYACVEINGSLFTDYVLKTVHHFTGNENFKTKAEKLYTADIFMVKQDNHFLLRITTEE